MRNKGLNYEVTKRESKRRMDYMSKVRIITTSLRAKSNSDILAKRAAEGAKDAGHCLIV